VDCVVDLPSLFFDSGSYVYVLGTGMPSRARGLGLRYCVFLRNLFHF
jgi:hypothetical protein